MTGYAVTIKEASKELSAKERLQMKDTTGAIKLNQATQEGDGVIIKPVMWAVLGIHNEKAKDNPDYENYLIVDDSGQRYVTGSRAFWSSFRDILDEMEGEEEEWAVRVYRMSSRNYNGKDFLTCAVI